jgi:hypothetical protein
METVLLLLIVLAFVIAFVVQPFSRAWPTQTINQPASPSLLSERERILVALQELDFDYSLGKIPAEEYTLQRADLVERGAQVLRQLDESRKTHHTDETSIRPTEEKPAYSMTQPSDEALEKMIAERRALREKKDGRIP